MLLLGLAIGVVTGLVAAALWIHRALLAPLDRLNGKPSRQVTSVRPFLTHFSARQRVAATERSLAEQAVSVTETMTVTGRLAAALEAIPQALIVWDGSGRELLRNRAGVALHADLHLEALLMPKVRELIGYALQGDQRQAELSLHGPPRRTLRITAAPLVLPDAAGPGASGPARPAVSSGALAVIEDQTAIHALHEIRRDFVANLSHELRTPIGAISLLAETVAAETNPEVVDRLTGRLVTESARLARVIDELLELSRIEHEEQQPHVSVQLQRIVDEAMARVRMAADSREVRLDVEVSMEPMAVSGDPQQLISALANLVENAVKYSEPGQTVVVRARRQQPGERTITPRAELVVSDKGIGIPQRDLERIFERFYRVDRSRRSDTGGTGLGLSIVRHIALNHGGTVEVVSAEGEGSTFTLRLPMTPAVQPVAEGPARATFEQVGK